VYDQHARSVLASGVEVLARGIEIPVVSRLASPTDRTGRVTLAADARSRRDVLFDS
jgi:hypothetical protein